MIARLAAFLLLAAGTAPALAQSDDDAIVRLIRGSYATYIGADDAPRPAIPMTARLKAAEIECAAMQKLWEKKEGADSAFGACSDDYDLLCQCQDPYGIDWSRIDVAITRPAAGRIDAAVTFPDGDGEPNIVWQFVRRGESWEIDDFREAVQGESGEGSYRTRLVASIEEMRRGLNMPAWKPPAS